MWHSQKALSDSITAEESKAADVGKTVADSLATSEDGVILMQGYCDFTYFDDDYVGIKQTF